MVENQRPGFERLLSAVHSDLGRAHRIGITGPPGAGKSTLTECLVASYRSRGLTVAVVAVDPTSPFTGGALLGDRIRMESVALDDGVFIRSMATRGSWGGLAIATREVGDLLDAAGFDRIVVETVGVGQSELAVGSMADTSVLVLVPESGDGIQALKAGIMEIRPIGRERIASDRKSRSLWAYERGMHFATFRPITGASRALTRLRAPTRRTGVRPCSGLSRPRTRGSTRCLIRSNCTTTRSSQLAG
jgi:Ni2+-binding GTPase involved in maturation of urease and hydrogenase